MTPLAVLNVFLNAVPARVPTRPALAALALAAGLSLRPEAAWAQHWQLTYQVHVGGVAVLGVKADLTLTGDRYNVEVDAATDGFLGRMFPWRSHSQSIGAVRPDGLAPQRHTQVGTFRGKPRTVKLDYDAAGNVTVEVTPPPTDDDREPVPDRLRRNTADPLSGVLGMLVAGLRGEGCARTVPVFDGRRRYDMQFGDFGTREVGKSRYSVFSGAARQCRVTYTPVAGYSRTPSGGSFWQRDSGPEQRPPVDLWIAPLTAGGPPFPVRVETDSAYGGVVAHLTGVTTPPQTAEKP